MKTQSLVFPSKPAPDSLSPPSAKVLEEERKLDKLVGASAGVIYNAHSVFPFKFFPDEMIIDEKKVSIFKQYFFYTEEISSIEYKDIFNVIVDGGFALCKARNKR